MRARRIALEVLLAVVALNAIGGGVYGLAGAEGVPREWLQGSPFHDYTLPSLFLLVVVGGVFTAACVAVWAGWRWARLLALGAGAVALAWIAAQVSIIGWVSWLQPATLAAGAAVLALAWRLGTGSRPLPA